ncbi:MAG: DUF3488 domain-containing transglutaminase family protein [Gammaproteobacteria bacterium]|nr:DUF3488 domain-containing transglutaminase family protein [Gammaproteobacteria bacterium]
MNARALDTPRLLWTLACLAAAAGPHLLHLPLWSPGLMVTTMLWRLAAQQGRLALPGTVVRLVLAFAGFAGVFVSYGTITGLDAGSTLLVVMAALKLTETKSVRDLIVLLLISYFLIVTQFLFGQSIMIALYAFPTIWLITTALSQVSSAAPTMPWRKAFARSGILLAHAVPVMLIAFVLFPRMSGPFWSIPRGDNTALTGLSDTMQPGSITRLLQSDAVAFRVAFDDDPPPPEQRYWRGPVLSNFDGRSWSIFQQHDREVQESSIELIGPSVSYEVTLEPNYRNWLFALEQTDPGDLPRRSYMTSDLRLVRAEPVTQLFQYRLQSWPQHRANADVGPNHWTLQRDRQFPQRTNRRAQALAQQWLAETGDPAAVVERILRQFRVQEFVYTLTPPALSRTDPVDDFLFNTRRGFCEHYASAFTLMMRAAGVPARVVLGYQGGELNPFSRHLTVRQSDAHAWSEVWLDGRGWIRVDPTAAVAPERVESGVAGALPDGEQLPGLFRSYDWLRQLQFGWDAVNNGWNQWVLGFSRQEQRSLLRALGMKRPNLQKMLLAMIGLITAVMAIIAAHMLWQSRPSPADPCARIYARFCRKLERVAGARADHEGPLDFARRVMLAHPAIAAPVEEVTRLYVSLRYFPEDNDSRIADLRRAVRALRV